MKLWSPPPPRSNKPNQYSMLFLRKGYAHFMLFCLSILNKVREAFPEGVIFKIDIKEAKRRKGYREDFLFQELKQGFPRPVCL